MEKLLGRNFKYSNGEEFSFNRLLDMKFVLLLFTFSECPLNNYLNQILKEFYDKINKD